MTTEEIKAAINYLSTPHVQLQPLRERVLTEIDTLATEAARLRAENGELRAALERI